MAEYTKLQSNEDDSDKFTSCPYCLAVFHLNLIKLEVRGGNVRCGACREVFNALHHLVCQDVDGQFRPLIKTGPEQSLEKVESTSFGDDSETPATLETTSETDVSPVTANSESTPDPIREAAPAGNEIEHEFADTTESLPPIAVDLNFHNDDISTAEVEINPDQTEQPLQDHDQDLAESILPVASDSDQAGEGEDEDDSDPLIEPTLGPLPEEQQLPSAALSNILPTKEHEPLVNNRGLDAWQHDEAEVHAISEDANSECFDGNNSTEPQGETSEAATETSWWSNRISGEEPVLVRTTEGTESVAEPYDAEQNIRNTLSNYVPADDVLGSCDKLFGEPEQPEERSEYWESASYLDSGGDASFATEEKLPPVQARENEPLVAELSPTGNRNLFDHHDHRATASPLKSAAINMNGVDSYIADRPNPLIGFFWFAVCIGFLVLLGLQVKLYHVERYAQDEKYRPYLSLFCRVAQCELPPRRDAYRFTITHTRIDLHPQQPGALRITVKLINQATFAQRYPDLQLTLTDRVGRVVGRRTFSPDFYLGERPGNNLDAGELGSVSFDLARPHEKAVGFVVDVVPGQSTRKKPVGPSVRAQV